jgi:hypothetical protein
MFFDVDKNLNFIEEGGHKRYLASRPSYGKMREMCTTSYKDSGNPVFPRSEWKAINRRATMPWIMDQNGHGSCVGNGWTAALRRARLLAGCKDVELSPGWTYSLINGDSDNGAVISDGIDALKRFGTCTFATVGQDPIYQRHMPSKASAEAQRFKLKAAYHCSSYEEVVSALLTGRFIPVYGYQVGRNFGDFDQYGVAGHSRGPGNHCNHADGLVFLPDGRPVLDDVNSWGEQWGPWNNGRVYIDEDHLFSGGDQPDVCVIEAFAEDPNEPNEPPVATGK